MVPVGSCFITVAARSRTSRAGSEADCTVVWLRGEHDISTTEALSLTVARAIAHDDAALVIDLSEAQFVSVATIGVIVRTREFLRLRSRSLTVRSASTFVRRVFDVCGLSDLLDPDLGVETSTRQPATALATWVEVPLTHRSDGHVAPSELMPSLTPDPVGVGFGPTEERARSAAGRGGR
jgi:anti-anti-sigma factor